MQDLSLERYRSDNNGKNSRALTETWNKLGEIKRRPCFGTKYLNSMPFMVCNVNIVPEPAFQFQWEFCKRKACKIKHIACNVFSIYSSSFPPRGLKNILYYKQQSVLSNYSTPMTGTGLKSNNKCWSCKKEAGAFNTGKLEVKDDQIFLEQLQERTHLVPETLSSPWLIFTNPRKPNIHER